MKVWPNELIDKWTTEWMKETEIDDPFSCMSSYFRNIFRFKIKNSRFNSIFEEWITAWVNGKNLWMNERMKEWKKNKQNFDL